MVLNVMCYFFWDTVYICCRLSVWPSVRLSRGGSVRNGWS